MFSDDVVNFIPLNKYHNSKEFNEAVSKLTYVRGVSNLGKSLE
jgi:hypothetical protein